MKGIIFNEFLSTDVGSLVGFCLFRRTRFV